MINVDCNKCHGPILKDIKLEGGEVFLQCLARCPHCRNDVTLKIVAKVERRIYLDRREVGALGSESEIKIL